MIRVYGSSDDLVEIEGDVEEELNVIDRPAFVTIRDKDGIAGVRIVAEYAPERGGPPPVGVWRLAVEQIDEDITVPWPVRVVTKHGYSLAVEVDCHGPNVTVEYHPKPDNGEDDES